MKIKDILKLHQKFEAQTSFLDALELYDAILSTPAGAVVELGSATGGTTIVLIQAAKEVDKMVYSIDPYPEELEDVAEFYLPGLMAEFKRKFQENILAGEYKNIIQYNKDISECINDLPQSLSVVFIDGCHEYDFVEKEFNLLWERVVLGGILFIHDIESPVGQLTNTEQQGVVQVLKWEKGEVISPTMLKIQKPWATVKSQTDMRIIARLESDLEKLKEGQDFNCPYYDEAQGRNKCF
jgi:predicted O-methyltransferase YrrM